MGIQLSYFCGRGGGITLMHPLFSSFHVLLYCVLMDDSLYPMLLSMHFLPPLAIRLEVIASLAIIPTGPGAVPRYPCFCSFPVGARILHPAPGGQASPLIGNWRARAGVAVPANAITGGRLWRGAADVPHR